MLLISIGICLADTDSFAQGEWQCLTEMSDTEAGPSGDAHCCTMDHTSPDTNLLRNLPNLIVPVNFHFFRPYNGPEWQEIRDPDVHGYWFVGDQPEHWTGEEPINYVYYAIKAIEVSNEYLEERFVTDDTALDHLESSIPLRLELLESYYWDSYDEYVNNFDNQGGEGGIDILVRDDKDSQNGGPSGSASYTGSKMNIFQVMESQLPAWYIVPPLILHELGHLFGLRHSQQSSNACNGVDLIASDETVDNGSKNVMLQGGPDDYLSITPCQFTRVYNRATCGSGGVANAFYFENCKQPKGPDIVIDSDQTWDVANYLNNDIKIVNGATLTISQCELRMGPNRRISISEGGKLVVDNGTITSLCDERWEGINVNGSVNNDFDVMVVNGSYIENAKTAVSFYPRGIPWPMHKSMDNGILIAENSVFNGCDRVAAFIAHSPKRNNSIISNCTINDCMHAITNWNCEGIRIHNNTFNNTAQDCIYTIDGALSITQNEMHSNERSINLNMTAPMATVSTIAGNQITSQVGVQSDGASITNNIIRDNDFSIDSRGVFLTGINANYIINNTITKNAFSGPGGPSGIRTMSTGHGANLVHKNTISRCESGITVLLENLGLSFEENCFKHCTGHADVNIVRGGTVLYEQGSQFQEAGNCFSHSGWLATNSQMSIDQASSQPFIYYVYPDEDQNCKDILNHAGPFIQGNASFESRAPCDNPGIPDEEEDFWIVDKSLPELLTQYSSVSQQLSNLAEDQPDARLNRNKQMLKMAIVNEYVSLGESANAIEMLSQEPSERDMIALYGIYLREENYDAARQLLSEIPPFSTEIADFLWVQQLNLKRLELGPTYNLSEQERRSLRQIGEKYDPLAAYARGLHFLLTGERIFIDADDEHGEQRSSYGIPGKDATIIYPNPSMDNFTVSLGEFIDTEYSIKVFNSFGELVDTKRTMEEKIYIDASNWPSGLYIIEIAGEGNKTTREKLILTH